MESNVFNYLAEIAAASTFDFVHGREQLLRAVNNRGSTWGTGLGEVEFDFVDIAPSPVLARFERFNNRMFRSVEMLGRVFVLR